jgi:flagellar biosynthesis protein FliP
VAALVGVLTALGIVLVVIGVSMAALRRFVSAPRGQGRLQMEVMQRLPLTSKQGIAVVRIGERVLAVTLGEGGVRPVTEFDPEEAQAMIEAAAQRPAPAFAQGVLPFTREVAPRLQQMAPRVRDFGVRLAERLRSSAALLAIILPLLALAGPAFAQAAPGAEQIVTQLAPQMDLRVGGSGGEGLRLSGTVGIVVMMGLLTLLPTLVLMMTSFTRIFIVLSFLKQAIGTQTAPPAHLVAALSLLLTGFVMAPTLTEANRTAIQPWLDGRIEQAEMLSTGVRPFRDFMFAQTRDQDIEKFIEMSSLERLPTTEDEVPLTVLMSAFVTSELKTAFQIGFALFLPFIIIDIVVASVLMSMGMFMLPPVMISLPFKLLLFVLVDGWTLVIQSLVASFR